MQYGFCFARAIFDLLNPICSRYIAMHDIIAHNMSLHKGKVFTKSCNSASLLQFHFLLGNSLPCQKNSTFEKLKLGNSLPWRGLGVALAFPWRGLGVALALPWWLALALPWRGLGVALVAVTVSCSDQQITLVRFGKRPNPQSLTRIA